MKRFWKMFQLAIIAHVASAVLISLSIVLTLWLYFFVLSHPQLEHGTYDHALSSLLPTAEELPKSVNALFDNGEFAEQSPDPSLMARTGWPMDFGFRGFVGNQPSAGPGAALRPQDFYLIVSEYRSGSEAAKAWRGNPVSLLFPDPAADAIWPRSKAFHTIPVTAFATRPGLEWDAQCFTEGTEPDVLAPGACGSFLASTHFCEWVLIVDIEHNPTPGWSMREVRLGELFDDVAHAVMKKVHCKSA